MGWSLRHFAEKVQVSATTLSYARRIFLRYPSATSVPELSNIELKESVEGERKQVFTSTLLPYRECGIYSNIFISTFAEVVHLML